MSKTPLISLNDGTSWADAVPKLRTDELGASTTDWVQEGDTKAASLKVTANGEYPAASAGKYGYDYVTVSVKGDSATGIGQDGNEHTVYPDPETGKLVDKLIPSSIVVTTPPTVTTYQDGDTIDFNGLVVTAYTMDGEVWTDADHPGGVIPFNELVLPVTTAVYDPDAPVTPGKVTTEFDIEPNPFDYGLAIQYSAWSVGGGAYRRSVIYYSLNGSVLFRSGNIYEDVVFAAASQGVSVAIDLDVYEVSKDEATGLTPEQIARSNLGTFLYNNHGAQALSSTYTYGGKTVYYTTNSRGISGYKDITPITSGVTEQIAWSMVYGDIVDGGNMQVPVTWQRPGDGAILEATFPINVTPAGT